MKNLFYAITVFSMLLVTTGCRSNSCEPSFCERMWANRPRLNCFRGDPCNTCTPPVGQPANCGTNFAPACEDCNGGGFGSGVQLPGPQPSFQNAPGAPAQGVPSTGVPYYPETIMNGASLSTPPTNTVGYPPVHSSVPLAGKSTEIETPPMYGMRDMFN